jgi:hypothetical protein
MKIWKLVLSLLCCAELQKSIHGQKVSVRIETWEENWERNSISLLVWTRLFGINATGDFCDKWVLSLHLNESRIIAQVNLCKCQQIGGGLISVIRCKLKGSDFPGFSLRLSARLSAAVPSMGSDGDPRCSANASAELSLYLEPSACFTHPHVAVDCLQHHAPPTVSIADARDLGGQEPAILTADVMHMHTSHGRGPLSPSFRRFAAAGGCHMARPGCLDYLAVLLRSTPLPRRMPRREADWHRQLGCWEGRCGACALVGNAWHLLGADLGAEIDAHAIVVRFGAAAPTEGFEADVGARTSLRVVVRPVCAR